MNKHRLFVAQTGANPPSTRIHFQCRNCVANMWIKREAMEDLLAGKPTPATNLGIVVWGECKGA